jgi:hypothetical protein
MRTAGLGASKMDEIAKRFVRELARGIAAAVARDPRIEACRVRARAAGFELNVSVEALLGAITIQPCGENGKGVAPPRLSPTLEMSTSDRRFLKSLRIAADDKAREQV